MARVRVREMQLVKAQKLKQSLGIIDRVAEVAIDEKKD